MPTWTLSAFADEAAAPLDEQIQALQKAGYRYLDPRNIDGTSIVDVTPEQAKGIKTKLDAANIKLQMFGSPIGKTDVTDDLQIELDRLDRLADIKDILDCTGVRMFSFYNKTQLDKDDFKSQVLDKLHRLRDHAAKVGLVLYHENESDIFGDHSDDVLTIAEALYDPDSFRLIYDFANYIRTGEDGWTTWQKMKSKTQCFHFKDQKSTGEHVPMGQGDTDALRILKDAVDAGWEGPCTLEPHLYMSKAVLDTGVHGTGSQSLADLSRQDVFHVAAEAGTAIAREAGATLG